MHPKGCKKSDRNHPFQSKKHKGVQKESHHYILLYSQRCQNPIKPAVMGDKGIVMEPAMVSSSDLSTNIIKLHL